MAITTTTNKSLIKVTVGTEAGTWGPYINSNQDLLDNFLAGTATVALTNSPVTLSSAQYQCAFIRFTGAITANVAITFPSIGSFYTVINDCTNSSAFIVTALTTAAGGRTIGLPLGTMTQIMTDGTNARYATLPPVGTYWDYAGSSVPAWVSACTIPPYLNCDGTTFSSATYPALTALLGSTTLPDARGRFRLGLDAGAGRVSSAVSGVAGNTILASGGDQSMQAHSHGGSVLAWINTAPVDVGNDFDVVQSVSGSSAGQDFSESLTVVTDGAGAAQNMPPVYVGGITLIRSA